MEAERTPLLEHEGTPDHELDVLTPDVHSGSPQEALDTLYSLAGEQKNQDTFRVLKRAASLVDFSVGVGRESIENIFPGRRVERLRTYKREEREAHRWAERRLDRAGFEFRMYPVSDDPKRADHLMSTWSRRGDGQPEKAIVFTPGLGGGWEEFVDIAAARELREYTIVLHNVYGSDPESTYDCFKRTEYFQKQVVSQRQAHRLALELGAEQVYYIGHSRGGKVTIANLDQLSELKDPIYYETVAGAKLWQGFGSKDLLEEAFVARVPGLPKALSRLAHVSERPLSGIDGRVAALYGKMPEALRGRLRHYEPEHVLALIASSAIIEASLWDIKGTKVFKASMNRVKELNRWRAVPQDLDCLTDTPELENLHSVSHLPIHVEAALYDTLLTQKAPRNLYTEIVQNRDADGAPVGFQVHEGAHCHQARYPQRAARRVRNFVEDPVGYVAKHDPR